MAWLLDKLRCKRQLTSDEVTVKNALLDGIKKKELTRINHELLQGINKKVLARIEENKLAAEQTEVELTAVAPPAKESKLDNFPADIELGFISEELKLDNLPLEIKLDLTVQRKLGMASPKFKIITDNDSSSIYDNTILANVLSDSRLSYSIVIKALGALTFLNAAAFLSYSVVTWPENPINKHHNSTLWFTATALSVGSYVLNFALDAITNRYFNCTENISSITSDELNAYLDQRAEKTFAQVKNSSGNKLAIDLIKSCPIIPSGMDKEAYFKIATELLDRTYTTKAKKAVTKRPLKKQSDQLDSKDRAYHRLGGR